MVFLQDAVLVVAVRGSIQQQKQKKKQQQMKKKQQQVEVPSQQVEVPSQQQVYLVGLSVLVNDEPDLRMPEKVVEQGGHPVAVNILVGVWPVLLRYQSFPIVRHSSLQ